MQLLSSLENFPFSSSVVTIGVFDGLHLGHQKIICQTVDYACQISAKSVLLTFKPHPQEIIAKKKVELITSYRQKSELINRLGINIYSELKFTPSFASLAPEDFVKKVLIDKLKIKALILGANYRFGKDEIGDTQLIRKLGNRYKFKVVIIPPLEVDKQIASSSLIRSFIKTSKFRKASKFLGRNWKICGKVFRDLGRGKKLGYPTANVYYPPEILIPKGVFAAEIILNGEKKQGMVNIGTRPTFSSDIEQKVEVYIFDFQKEIYGDKIKLILKHKIRNERKFSNKEKLVEQIKRDKETVRRYLLCKNF